MLFKSIAKVLGICFVAANTAKAYVEADQLSAHPQSQVIERDVAIIGGGSSGVYTAFGLIDSNHSVVVIETKDRLGGHAQTYTDPQNGVKIDIGVVVFELLPVVTDYFARFNIPLTKISGLPTGPVKYVDFATGKTQAYTRPNHKKFFAAVKAYRAQLARFPELQHGFNLTYPVDPELLMPFGDFIAKYKLGNMMQVVFEENQGYSPLLNLTTLYMFKYLNSYQTFDFKHGSYITAHYDTSQLYEKATAELGDNVLLNSHLLSMDRPSSGPVKLVVQTPNGQKIIKAKKLVSAIPPTLGNLQKYDLSSTEKDLFGQFSSNGYYTGLLNNTGLGDISLKAIDKSKPFNIPAPVPGVYTFAPSPVPNITHVYYGKPTPYDVDAVKADIAAALNRVQSAQGLPQTPAEWVVFSDHSPFNLHVPNQAVQDKFYDKMYSLQGQRNTFYNGAFLMAQDSSVIWQFTQDYLLPKIKASLAW